MQVTRDWTERPHGALLQPGIDIRQLVYRIGGRLRSTSVSSYGAAVGIPPSDCWIPNRDLENPRQYQAGSLTGAVASERATEASKGSLSADRNRAKSIKAEGSLTARQTRRAEAKAGLSDPVERKWNCHRSTDKSYPGDNRLISPKSPYRRGGLAPRCRLITSWG